MPAPRAAAVGTAAVVSSMRVIRPASSKLKVIATLVGAAPERRHATPCTVNRPVGSRQWIGESEADTSVGAMALPRELEHRRLARDLDRSTRSGRGR